MSEMTGRERIGNILDRKPVDRIGLYESFWGDTQKHWKSQGFLREDEDLYDHFGMDMRNSWPLVLIADLDNPETILEETEETKLVRNGNGAVLRWWKDNSGVPEHVDFLVQDRAGWEEHIKPKLLNEDDFMRRINFEHYSKTREKCHANDFWFNWSGVNVFELMHPVCGHEYMLMGMALDPQWVLDMSNTYADITIKLMEILFEKEGRPDGLFFYEDMGFKERPFMSPKMYKELIWPAHKRTFDYAHSIGCKVIVHSCGFVEALVPGLIEAGMDCLQAMEVKAGMDLLRLKKNFGDQIAFCGGLDIRVLETNDPGAVEKLLQEKIPPVMAGSGYILHSDHSIPTSVNYETYKYFVERGLEIGTY